MYSNSIQNPVRVVDLSSKKLICTNEAFTYHWTVWKLTGIEAPPHISKRLYICYSIFINFFVTILFPITLVANVLHTENLQQLCENLTITVTDIIANLKFLNVFFVRTELRQIKNILRELDKRASNEEEQQLLLGAVRTAQNSFRIFCGIFTVGTFLSLIKVAIAKERILLYPAWFYVDWKNSVGIYAFVFIYQLFGLIVQAIQDCANDSYPPAYLCILAAHMKALALRVRRIGNSQADEKLLHGREEMLERNYEELVACIKDYLNVLKLHQTIHEIISVACFAQFLCSALVQCTVALHFLYVVDQHDLSAQILSIIFFVAITLEVYIICYFGHDMREQSETLLSAFYSCNWIEQMPKFKRNLIITLLRTHKPCEIMAGKYIPVDLNTFVKVLKTTYSVFTLLMRFK